MNTHICEFFQGMTKAGKNRPVREHGAVVDYRGECYTVVFDLFKKTGSAVTLPEST